MVWPSSADNRIGRLGWNRRLRVAVAFGLIVAVALAILVLHFTGGAGKKEADDVSAYEWGLTSPKVVLCDANIPYPGKCPTLVMNLCLRLSNEGKLTIADIDGHPMDRARIVKSIRFWVEQAENGPRDYKRAVFDLTIDETEIRSVPQMAQAIREFNDAAKEAGSPEKVILLVSVPGLKGGEFSLP